MLTAKTRPAASFEGKPLTANCRIPVTFQIKDRTRVAAEGASLDREELFLYSHKDADGRQKSSGGYSDGHRPADTERRFFLRIILIKGIFPGLWTIKM